MEYKKKELLDSVFNKMEDLVGNGNDGDHYVTVNDELDTIKIYLRFATTCTETIEIGEKVIEHLVLNELGNWHVSGETPNAVILKLN